MILPLASRSHAASGTVSPTASSASAGATRTPATAAVAVTVMSDEALTPPALNVIRVVPGTSARTVLNGEIDIPLSGGAEIEAAVGVVLLTVSGTEMRELKTSAEARVMTSSARVSPTASVAALGTTSIDAGRGTTAMYADPVIAEAVPN